MKVGDIDGVDTIYTENGELILRPNEKNLYSESNSHALDVNTNWKPWGKCVYDSNAGDGNFYITDQRLVHIRKPNPWKAAKGDATLLGLPRAIAKYMRTKDLENLNVCEYCEIEYNDIKKYRAKHSIFGDRTYINIYFLNENGEKFWSPIFSKNGEKVVYELLQKKGIEKK